ncbi:MAG: cytochrome c biosis protein, transrane [Acidobacteria bacterium]|nr:cytochrome c biosis protein, transrane [Acidobacteriota bacterium]
MESVSLVAAFTAGLVSFLSPCVLPLVPGYISLISGASMDQLKSSNNEEMLRRVLGHSLLFILGFSVVFISLGASATWLGQALLSRMTILYKIAGIVIIIFGLHLTGILKIGLLYRDARFH